MKNSQNSTNKFTNNDLKTMQSWNLDYKIQVTKARIIEFAEKMNNKIYVLMSYIFILY